MDQPAGLRALLRGTGSDVQDVQDVLAAVGFAALRARVVWVCSLWIAVVVALCNLIDSPAFPIRSHPEVGIGVPVVLTLQGCWALARGARMTDTELLAVFLTWPVMVAGSFVGLQTVGSPFAGEWSVLVSAIIVALLVRRGRSVALMTVVVCVCMAWTVWSRLAATGLAPVTVVTETTIVATIVFAFRAVRGVAVRALARANRGEVTDPLTGLANRRGLERYGPPLWEGRARSGEPVAVLVVDIDHFKRINDTQGHAAGDVVIQQVADALRRSLREGDVAVRLGGEEFLLLANVPTPDVVGIAERLRVTIEQTLAPVTVSIGVLEARPHLHDPLPEALWTVVDAADQALYQAKRTGRNRVVTGRAGGPPPGG